MAIEHWFTVMCENMIVSDKGKLTLVEIAGNFSVKSLPAKIKRIFVVTGVSGKPGDTFSIDMVSPDGEAIQLTKEEVLTKENIESATTNKVVKRIAHNEIADLTFIVDGIYQIVLKDGERVVNRYSFGVYKPTEVEPEKGKKNASRSRSTDRSGSTSRSRSGGRPNYKKA